MTGGGVPGTAAVSIFPLVPLRQRLAISVEPNLRENRGLLSTTIQGHLAAGLAWPLMRAACKRFPIADIHPRETKG